MSLANLSKQEVIETYQRFKGDTGSPEVQIAILSSRISSITDHLKKNKHDFHSRRGLLKMVSRRRKLLDYLKRVNYKVYAALIAQLGLRR